MGFETITNTITTAVNAVMSTNSLTARYDNDSRDTPTDDYWVHVSLEYGESNQVEIGEPLYRTPGILTMMVHGPLQSGAAGCLSRADILATAFRSVTLGVFIKFRTPKIVNVGRIGDKWVVNVICPFHADEN